MRAVVGQVEKVGAGGEQLAAAEHRLSLCRPVEVEHGERGREPVELLSKLAVELVATDARQVVPLGGEEGALEIAAGGDGGGRLARAGPLVDLADGLLPRARLGALPDPLPLLEPALVR